MFLELNFNSGKATYLQIVDQVRMSAASGALRAGEALPGIRTLAEQPDADWAQARDAFVSVEAHGEPVTVPRSPFRFSTADVGPTAGASRRGADNAAVRYIQADMADPAACRALIGNIDALGADVVMTTDPDADRIAAPMPGLVKVVNVAPGDTVSKGDPVIVMEAMKMEHTLTAPRDGTIGELMAGAGDQVEEGTVLLAMADT